VSGFAALEQGVLLPSLVPPPVLSHVFQELTKFSRNHSAQVPVSDPLTLLAFPASYSSYSNGSLVLHLQIPLISSSYNLYQYLPFPILFEDDHSLSFQVHTDTTLVAEPIDYHSITHLYLRPSSLDTCIHLTGRYFCSHLIVPKNNSDQLCMKGIFLDNIKMIHENCDLHPFTSSWAIHQISHDNYKLYTATKLQAQESCLHHRKRMTIPSGISEIRLRPGCSFHSDAFDIPALSYLLSEVRLLSHSWDLSVIFNLISNGSFNSSHVRNHLTPLSKLRQARLSLREISDELSAVASAPVDESEEFPLFGLFHVSHFTLFLVLVLFLCIFHTCLYRRAYPKKKKESIQKD